MPPPIIKGSTLKEKQIAVSNCMLEQTMGTVVGVGAGLAYGLSVKKLLPFVLITTAGSAADLAYGYYHACTDVIDDFNAAKKWEEGKTNQGAK
jgi:hypothetical protein